MQIATFIMTLVLQVVCKEQELCEIFPRNQKITYGSDITVSLKALPNSDCHKKIAFKTSGVYWTLNNQRIPKTFYDYNTTFVSVYIQNFSLAQGTIECLVDDDILGGAIFRSYYVLNSPQNVSCVGRVDFVGITCNLTCKWHLDHTENTNYTVLLKQNSNVKTCKSIEKSCTFANEGFSLLKESFTITVIAENPLVKVYSDNITYDNGWSIVQINPPDVYVEPELTDLRVTWNNNAFRRFGPHCEVYFADQEKSLYAEPLKCLKVSSENSCLLTEVKPCTNYTISVCCKLEGSVWSACSRNVSVLTYINVSHVQLYVWRSKSVLSDKGKRTVHLMWKGVPPSCHAFDEYRIFEHTHSSSISLKSYQNHTFITLDDNYHRFSVAVFHNGTRLSETFIDIPNTAEDLDSPSVHNVSVFVKDGHIHVRWDKPTSAVSGYIIVWNSTDQDHLWQKIEETHISLKGEPFTLYTISVSPIYEDGPGNEFRLDECTNLGMPPDMSEVSMKWISDKKAEVQWVPALHKCHATVVNYTVIYKARDQLKPRNVTVDGKQRTVILDDLRPSTVYNVQVIANAIASSSYNNTKEFSTKQNGEGSLTISIAYCVGLALMIVSVILIVIIRRKYLSERFPNPQFSSLSLWSSQNDKTHWNPLAAPWDSESEKILPCQLDTEATSIFQSSRRELKPRMLPAQNATRQKGNMVMATSPITIEFPSASKKETTQPFPLTDVYAVGISPLQHSQSSYRIQTPLTSPVESPKKSPLKLCSPEENEVLLKPKPQNGQVTTYVTVKMLEHDKDQRK